MMAVPKDTMKETPSSPRPLVTIVGAGPVGALLAVTLSRRNRYDIRIIERREDFRKKFDDIKGEGKVNQVESTTKRSINLALSLRGISALDRVGLKDKVMSRAISMKGRVIHGDENTPLGFHPYGTGDQAINSVNRGEIACILLDELARVSEDTECSVEVWFESKLESVSKEGVVRCTRSDGTTQEWMSDTIFGCDGLYSPTRENMRRMGAFNMNMQYYDCAYKELVIAPTADGDFALPRPDGLHIWPRGEYMVIALPNPDKSFTATLFGPMKCFEDLENGDVAENFKRDFPTAYNVMPEFERVWAEYPVSQLASLTVSPYNYKDRILLLGDSCHGTMPFYGQGMNCGFEDVLIFDDFMNQYNNDLSEAVPKYSAHRAPAANTIIELSNQNYVEMSDSTRKRSHVLRKHFDNLMHKCLGSLWIPLYTMVVFTRIPYDIALRKAKRQDRLVANGLKTAAAVALVAGSSALFRYRSPLHSLCTGVWKMCT